MAMIHLLIMLLLAEKPFEGIGTIPMTFIRAPYIESVWNDTEILAEADGHIVAARQKNQLVTAFHPELNDNLSVHKYFIQMIKDKQINHGDVSKNV